MFLKISGPSFINLSKTFAKKMKLLMMIAIDMIQPLQIMFI